MPHTLYQVDAFTEHPFKGNPAAVCLLSGSESNIWMQNLASEMNLSETAFLLPEGESWQLRWFTPKAEVDLCGHATLASAMVLFEMRPTLRDRAIKFQTRSGELKALWVDGGVELDFPAMVPNQLLIETQVSQALGFQPVEGVYSGNYFLFRAEDEKVIRNTNPNFAALEELPMPEVIITAKSESSEFDFISRFFAPQLGIDEDPVTGSAHCLLATFWAEKLGMSEFNAFQASQRGGTLHLKLEGDRVHITGNAKIIFKADLLV